MGHYNAFVNKTYFNFVIDKSTCAIFCAAHVDCFFFSLLGQLS